MAMSKPLSAHGQGSSDTQMRSTSKLKTPREAPTLPHTRWAAQQLHHGGESIHAATLPAHQRPRGSREAGAPSPGLVPTTLTCILDLRGNGGRFCFRTPTCVSVLASRAEKTGARTLVSWFSNHSTVTDFVASLKPETTAGCTRPEASKPGKGRECCVV